MEEIIFLIILGLLWVIFAVVQDLKKREIADWLNFSLIIFALGYRFFYSLFSSNGFNFFYQGLFGFAVFFILGNLFYYGRLFAGGDAKLLIALGPVIAIKESFFGNVEFLLIFLMIFLLTGAVYTLIASIYFMSKHFKSFKKNFSKQFRRHKKSYLLALMFSIILLVLGMFAYIEIAYLAILVFVFPLLYIYSKAVDESSMIKTLGVEKLREGDWLYKNVKVGNKTIKATWEGLKKEEIMLLKKGKKKNIRIRQGVPFGPVFLISYLIYFLWVLF